MTKFNNDYFKNLLPKRPENSHKGTFGSVLNIAGSGFYSGAAYFSSVAPLKVGCGRSTLASVRSVLNAVSSLSPDVILMPLAETREKTFSPRARRALIPKLGDYQAISIGCGLSTDKDTAKFFEKLIFDLKDVQTPVLIDADGLNIISRHCETGNGGADKKYTPKQSRSQQQLPQNTVLTPHPKEMSRLMGVSVENILSQPEFWVKKCCEKFNCVTVLKLHKTLVADNKGHFYENNTGNSALSHGGSGDVLCGMITGFLAQGMNPYEASVLAVYLHGKTAEIASEELTEYSALASDLIKYIPSAIKALI